MSPKRRQARTKTRLGRVVLKTARRKNGGPVRNMLAAGSKRVSRALGGGHDQSVRGKAMLGSVPVSGYDEDGTRALGNFAPGDIVYQKRLNAHELQESELGIAGLGYAAYKTGRYIVRFFTSLGGTQGGQYICWIAPVNGGSVPENAGPEQRMRIAKSFAGAQLVSARENATIRAPPLHSSISPFATDIDNDSTEATPYIFYMMLVAAVVDADGTPMGNSVSTGTLELEFEAKMMHKQLSARLATSTVPVAEQFVYEGSHSLASNATYTNENACWIACHETWPIGTTSVGQDRMHINVNDGYDALLCDFNHGSATAKTGIVHVPAGSTWTIKFDYGPKAGSFAHIIVYNNNGIDSGLAIPKPTRASTEISSLRQQIGDLTALVKSCMATTSGIPSQLVRTEAQEDLRHDGPDSDDESDDDDEPYTDSDSDFGDCSRYDMRCQFHEHQTDGTTTELQFCANHGGMEHGLPLDRFIQTGPIDDGTVVPPPPRPDPVGAPIVITAQTIDINTNVHISDDTRSKIDSAVRVIMAKAPELCPYSLVVPFVRDELDSDAHLDIDNDPEHT